MAQQQAITATGLKGFLQWLQQDQPGVYRATAAKIAKAVPSGFSGFNGSVLKAARLAKGRRSMGLRGYRIGALGQCNVETCDVSLSSVGTCAAMQVPDVNIDTSCAANSGTTCASTLTGVANIISSVSGAVLGQEQQDTYSSIVSSQLQRASSGLSPLNLSSTAAGVPLISGLTGSAGTLLLIGGAALLLFMFARKGRGGA